MIGCASFGTLSMTRCPSVAIDLPLRILIWEDDGGYVRLGHDKPEWIVLRQGNDDGPNPKIEAIRTALSDTLTGEGGGKS